MSRGFVGALEVHAETVHAAPAPGLTFCPCCDKTPVEFTPYDRVAREPGEVNCGRLTATDERLLAESAAG